MMQAYRSLFDGSVVQAIQWINDQSLEAIQALCPYVDRVSCVTTYPETMECLQIPPSPKYDAMYTPQSKYSYCGRVIAGGWANGTGKYILYSKRDFERLYKPFLGN